MLIYFTDRPISWPIAASKKTILFPNKLFIFCLFVLVCFFK